MYKVNNAVIMAAGTSSRFAPLSYEKPKALIEVRGEVLIERQIRQLREAGIEEIYIVTGYMAEQFSYLADKYGVVLRHNPYYETRNNNASIKVVEDILKNTYICSADNYFLENPFENVVTEAFYSAVYADGDTKEWCITTDAEGYISRVEIGGRNAWYMLGHTFWDEAYSKKFVEILDQEYDAPETADKLWEDIYIEHISELKMKIRKYPKNEIFEFDTLDELREFDGSYVNDTRSRIIKKISEKYHVSQGEVRGISTIKGENNEAIGFSFYIKGNQYKYDYATEKISELGEE
ncbi:MAG: NTP transferase domain-containing protein [Lachnospiraceae bacterium]|nr:NTP transferase domain-containing protein [Lachnospiraceae bacterium]